MKIGIVNNSIGNVASVYSALKFYSFDVDFVDKPNQLDRVDMIMLAGVGNFRTAVKKIKGLGLWQKLTDEVLRKKKPVLGICLGMQLFADIGYEDGENKGFGWIAGKVVKIDSNLARIPHIGWDTIKITSSEIFQGMRYSSFYFMHSYHFVPDDKNVVLATTTYDNVELVSVVRQDNIFGVQFHPEKSQGDGLRLLKNIVEIAI